MNEALIELQQSRESQGEFSEEQKEKAQELIDEIKGCFTEREWSKACKTIQSFIRRIINNWCIHIHPYYQPTDESVEEEVDSLVLACKVCFNSNILSYSCF